MNNDVIVKAMEECCELVQACSKYLNRGGKRNEAQVLDEAADALVTITDLLLTLDIDEDKFFKRVEKSKKKFDKYMKENEHE